MRNPIQLLGVVLDGHELLANLALAAVALVLAIAADRPPGRAGPG